MPLRILNLADTTACLGILRALEAAGEVVTRPATAEALRQELPLCDAYLASLHVQLTRDLLEQASHLKVIGTPSTGLDHIDMDAARELGIRVISLREAPELLDSITATAELAWGLLLAVVRQLPWSFEAALQGRWARDEFRGHQLSGQTLGICGYGRLGRIVAEYGRAFRMPVLACDTRDFEAPSGVQRVDFATLLRESDVLSVHIHLTPENRHLFGREEFAAIKAGAVFINTSRGAIVDQAALLDALQSGHLGGAGLDVIDGEWDTDLANHPLISYARSHRNLVISPHTGGVTYESQRQVYEYIVNRLAAHLKEVSST